MSAQLGSKPTCRIRSIWRFPIKSFQGESVNSALLQPQGIFADRPLALLDKGTGKILSGKNHGLGEQILTFEARYEADPVPGKPLPDVVAQVAGKECRTSDARAFASACSEALGTEVELVTAGGAPAVYDTYWPEVEGLVLSDQTIEFPLAQAEAGSFADLEPLHLLTTASMKHLAGLAANSAIDTARFRPSIVLDTGDEDGFLENDWSGCIASLGSARVEFGAVAPRCIMTTRPQAGFPRDLEVLRTLARENRQEFMGMQMPCLGVYAKVLQPGSVSVGDELTFS
ncbi:MAG: MOSC domain-containing protein [Candidatus Binatia bacterium]|nr:MOSC domain-containing protein [Candidatus Binatia bacterium]